jgi:predicted acylesterase/phospholipase RssA
MRMPLDAPTGNKIALCFSGGGLRASFFHFGTICYLRAAGLLDRVKIICGVSGGAITAAYVKHNWRNLCSENNQDNFQCIANFKKLGSRDIRNNVLQTWLAEQEKRNSLSNILDLIARREPLAVTNNLSQLLADEYAALFWENTLMSQLTGEPIIALQATMTGRGMPCWLLSNTGPAAQSEIAWLEGDSLNSTPCNIRIADAVAASSAFPPLFPPMELPIENNVPIPSRFCADGGIYDNSGLSYLFHKPNILEDVSHVIISDANKPYDYSNDLRSDNVVDRVQRTIDVLMKRVTTLDVKRATLELNSRSVVHINIIDSINENLRLHNLSNDLQRKIPRMRTDLDAFTKFEVAALISHGYHISKKHLTGLAELPPQGFSIDDCLTDVSLQDVSLETSNAYNFSQLRIRAAACLGRVPTRTWFNLVRTIDYLLLKGKASSSIYKLVLLVVIIASSLVWFFIWDPDARRLAAVTSQLSSKTVELDKATDRVVVLENQMNNVGKRAKDLMDVVNSKEEGTQEQLKRFVDQAAEQSREIESQKAALAEQIRKENTAIENIRLAKKEALNGKWESCLTISKAILNTYGNIELEELFALRQDAKREIQDEKDRKVYHDKLNSVRRILTSCPADEGKYYCFSARDWKLLRADLKAAIEIERRLREDLKSNEAEVLAGKIYLPVLEKRESVDKYAERVGLEGIVVFEADGKASIDFILIPPTRGEADSSAGEKCAPLDNCFYISKNPITVAQFKAFIDATGWSTSAQEYKFSYAASSECELESPSSEALAPAEGRQWNQPGFAQTDTCPVVCVSNRDACAFAIWYSTKSQVKVSLPSKVELRMAINTPRGVDYALLFSKPKIPTSAVENWNVVSWCGLGGIGIVYELAPNLGSPELLPVRLPAEFQTRDGKPVLIKKETTEWRLVDCTARAKALPEYANNNITGFRLVMKLYDSISIRDLKH